MSRDDSGTEELIERLGRGEADARERLLARHRPRLRKMVAIRLDRRVAARVDPSDVVQETLIDAARKLDDYLRERPIPYYPWLHRLAAEQVVIVHRRHLGTQARAVGREAGAVPGLSGAATHRLVDRLVASQTSPSQKASREEQRRQVHESLALLSESDREVLVMHYLEQLDFDEIAAILGITPGAAKVRHFRALARLRPLLDDEARHARP